MTIDASREASVQMDSAPDNPALATTVLTSFWQNNLIGLRAERLSIGRKRARARCNSPRRPTSDRSPSHGMTISGRPDRAPDAADTHRHRRGHLRSTRTNGDTKHDRRHLRGARIARGQPAPQRVRAARGRGEGQGASNSRRPTTRNRRKPRSRACQARGRKRRHGRLAHEGGAVLRHAGAADAHGRARAAHGRRRLVSHHPRAVHGRLATNEAIGAETALSVLRRASPASTLIAQDIGKVRLRLVQRTTTASGPRPTTRRSRPCCGSRTAISTSSNFSSSGSRPS